MILSQNRSEGTREMKKTALSVLVSARKLLTPRKAWIKGDFGRTARGTVVVTPHPEAVKFCSAGAIRQAGAGALRIRRIARAALSKQMDGDIISFNDGDRRTHQKVLAAFDRAIKAAQR